MDVMSIIKFHVSIPEAVKAIAKFKENRIKAFENFQRRCALLFRKV
jgi:hypothetical protein